MKAAVFILGAVLILVFLGRLLGSRRGRAPRKRRSEDDGDSDSD